MEKTNNTEKEASEKAAIEASNFINCLDLLSIPKDSKSLLLGDFQYEFNDLIKILQEDIAEGKISYQNKQKFIRTFNKAAKAYLGKGVFSITDAKINSSEKVKKTRKPKDEIVLTLTGAKNNSANELDFRFTTLYGFGIKDSRLNEENKILEIDLELNQIKDAGEKRICFEYLWSADFLSFTLQHNDFTKIYAKKLNAQAKRLGRNPETLEKVLKHCCKIDELYHNSGLGEEDHGIVKLAELGRLRSEKGIQEAIKNGEHTKLYHALFPSGLVSRDTFDQAIKDNIDLSDAIVFFNFKYSENFENEGKAKKEEIQGRLMLVRGKLDEAWKYFKESRKTCIQRYTDREFDQGETPNDWNHDHNTTYGAILYKMLQTKYQDQNTGKGDYTKSLDHYIECQEVIIDLESQFMDTQLEQEFWTHIYFIKNYLVDQIDRRKNIEKRMKRMVAQYSHTLGNTLFPETIHKVSEELKNHIDFKENSLILRKAYHAEVLVKHQAEMLRAKHGSESGAEFRQYILSARLEENSKDDSITVRDILGSAAERVVGRLLNQKFGKLRKVRKHLEDKNKMSLDKLRNDFEERVFFNEKLTAIEWIEEKLGKTKIGKISPSWGKVLIRNDGYAHALLQGHWGELLFNALKYADHKKGEFLTLKFEEEKKEEFTWLQMIWENPSVKKDDKSSGQGLEGIEEDLRQLNEEESDYTLNIENKNNRFRVTLNYRSDLLMLEESNTPELEKNYFS